MKGILTHCKRFEVRDSDSKKESGFNDCVVAQISFETNDSFDTITKFRAEIEKMTKDVGKNIVVLFPFAHLSNDLLDDSASASLLLRLRDELDGFLDVNLLTFGTDKEFMIDAYGHPGSVRFRSF